ncbi:hypothetical protein SAMN04489713_119174 [Actinomadura madurae]|uniref:Uncharacterized protein n=1 Tax=Actinomadura madurae TaxID=1993 RepID=A0A1I5UF66_9ACTN|nr:hypothetical protein SAMN04489713_119174 [Actinomadura madurae]
MRRSLACVAAVVLLALFAAAVLGMSWAIADGPDGIRGWALILVFVVAGLVVMGLWMALLMAGAGDRPVWSGVAVVAGVVALIFAGTVPAWFSEWLLYERGRVSTCRVVTVTEVETVNGSGSAYRYRLACDGGDTVSVTRSDRTLQVDQRVRVRHDPEGKSDKAELVGDTEGMKPQDIAWTAGAELGLITFASLALIATSRPGPSGRPSPAP